MREKTHRGANVRPTVVFTTVSCVNPSMSKS
jgi:hypothetical protein